MNQNEQKYSAIDASCRVPLLALLGPAVLWLIVGLALALAASLTFHIPDLFASCPFFTYGHLQPAANDAIVYGFAIPAALGVMLWIFARMGETELLLPLVPIAAAHIWHIGVLLGLVGIFIGDSTGFEWLEFPRPAAILIFVAFLLIAISAMATFGARRDRTLQTPHWFLLASLLWFPWIYSTANLFLVAFPVRGVTQSVIDWWFTNNLLFVWFALAGLGIAFYLISKIAARPVQAGYFALFGFWTFVLFAPWCGMPQGAPVPAWLPATSTVASMLLIMPLIALFKVFLKTICGTNVQCKGGPYCYAKFATAVFFLSTVIVIVTGALPCFGQMVSMTWHTPAHTYLEIFGFLAIAICGGIYELLSPVMGFDLPFPKFVRLQHWLFMLGVAFLFIPLAIGGVIQGHNLENAAMPFTDIVQATLVYLRISTLGLLFLLLGSLLLATNIFSMTIKWHVGVIKCVIGAVKAPLETGEAKR